MRYRHIGYESASNIRGRFQEEFLRHILYDYRITIAVMMAMVMMNDDARRAERERVVSVCICTINMKTVRGKRARSCFVFQHQSRYA